MRAANPGSSMLKMGNLGGKRSFAAACTNGRNSPKMKTALLVKLTLLTLIGIVNSQPRLIVQNCTVLRVGIISPIDAFVPFDNAT